MRFCNHKITQIFTRNCKDKRGQRTEVKSLFSIFYFLSSGLVLISWNLVVFFHTSMIL